MDNFSSHHCCSTNRKTDLHDHCPEGSDSSCKYHLDVTHNFTPYNGNKCRPFIYRKELISIFDRLISDDLLTGDFADDFQQGLDQNQNESLIGVVWSRCPKQIFCEIQHLVISVFDGFSQPNNGANRRYYLINKLRLKLGMMPLKGFDESKTFDYKTLDQKSLMNTRNNDNLIFKLI